MASDTIVDIYCHIFPDKFFQEMNRIAPRLGNIGARLRGVKKLFDLDERFREMDQFGDYREIISLPTARSGSTSRASATTPWPNSPRAIPSASRPSSPRSR